MNKSVNHVNTMFSAIEQGDMDTFKACFTPDGVVWHNSDEIEQAIDDVCTGLAQLHAASTKLTYEDQRIVRADNLYFVQHVLTAPLKSGGMMRLPAMMRIETNGEGLITRLDEYFDSRATDCLMP